MKKAIDIIKEQAYSRAYYPKEIRGKYKVEVVNGELKVIRKPPM